jgi:hypothetical protein
LPGTFVAAPKKVKQTQAVWDTSDVSGLLEPAAYDPYARTASPAEAAAMLVAELKAHAPDATVLPLITKEAAAAQDQVGFHS